MSEVVHRGERMPPMVGRVRALMSGGRNPGVILGASTSGEHLTSAGE
jgi:hypothetical protein